jgi:hypothetical protein
MPDRIAEAKARLDSAITHKRTLWSVMCRQADHSACTDDWGVYCASTPEQQAEYREAIRKMEMAADSYATMFDRDGNPRD